MPVAKTYEKMALQGEPFKENGKMYVNVLAPKGIKKVRWYTDAEYRRMYPSIAIVTDEMDFDARTAFGFGEAGYITLYRGRNVEEWAENDRTGIWYNLTFGYYSPSKQKPAQDLNGIEAIQLKWEMVAAEGCKMKPHDEVKRIIMGMTKVESGSAYQGEVDAWLEKEVTVRAKKSKDSRFGTKHTYTLVDAEDNTYIWETGAKDYPCDKVISLKMKVKEHKEVDGEKVTVVWYCKEV